MTKPLAAMAALAAAYVLGFGLFAGVLAIHPPVGMLRSPAPLYGLGMAVAMAVLVVMGGPRLPWGMRWTVALAVVLALAPGALLGVNVSVEPWGAERHTGEVVGWLEVRNHRAASTWFHQVRDERDRVWNVAFEPRTVGLPVGSRGTLTIHRGLLGLRWTTLDEARPPEEIDVGGN